MKFKKYTGKEISEHLETYNYYTFVDYEYYKYSINKTIGNRIFDADLIEKSKVKEAVETARNTCYGNPETMRVTLINLLGLDK